MVKTNITITLVNDKNESINLTEEEARSAYLKLKELFEKNITLSPDWTYYLPNQQPKIQVNDLPYWEMTWTGNNSSCTTAKSITVKVS